MAKENNKQQSKSTVSDRANINPGEDRIRFNLRIHTDIFDVANYYASKHDMSINDYLVSAVELAIAHENKDYDLPTMEIQRVNQLTEGIISLETTVAMLNDNMNAGFDSLLGLTRGDTYLSDEEDGEL